MNSVNHTDGHILKEGWIVTRKQKIYSWQCLESREEIPGWGKKNDQGYHGGTRNNFQLMVTVSQNIYIYERRYSEKCEFIDLASQKRKLLYLVGQRWIATPLKHSWREPFIRCIHMMLYTDIDQEPTLKLRYSTRVVCSKCALDPVNYQDRRQ